MQGYPLPPDKALSLMMEKAGTQLDPTLFKFFTNMMGIFPIGTLVMLDTKELGSRLSKRHYVFKQATGSCHY